MEETSQEEKQELEVKDPNEEQGGILRRLRDRDLLRKRKAEAEEKETNQEESPRKRQRADKSGAKRRGRPRKSQLTPEISVSQEEEVVGFQEVPAVVPEPAEVIPDQSSGSVESQPAPVLAAPASLPVFGSLQSPVFAPTLTSPAAVDPTPTLITPPLFASSSAGVSDTSPAPVEELAPSKDPVTDPVSVPVPVPVPDPAPDETPVLTAPTPPAASSPPAAPAPFAASAISAAPPAAPAPPATPAVPLQEGTFISTQGREALNQVLIEDLGPDDEEDVTLPEDKRDDAGLSETPSFSASEQNLMFSVPTLTSQPPPQEYLPGNSI